MPPAQIAGIIEWRLIGERQEIPVSSGSQRRLRGNEGGAIAMAEWNASNKNGGPLGPPFAMSHRLLMTAYLPLARQRP